MVWDWVPTYLPLIFSGLLVTLSILVFSVAMGFMLALAIGLVQVTGPRWLARLALGFCTAIRGTPLLIQLWLLYYGLGSTFPLIPGMRENFLWLIRLDAYYYALLAFTLSFAGYEGEVMRGAFLSVPKGELEAARSVGMSPFQVVRRVWAPRAIRQALPTLNGEVVSQLKSTPLVFTIPVLDLMGVIAKVRQETYLTYEPLLFLAAIYMCLTFVLTRIFGYFERQTPVRR